MQPNCNLRRRCWNGGDRCDGCQALHLAQKLADIRAGEDAGALEGGLLFRYRSRTPLRMGKSC